MIIIPAQKPGPVFIDPQYGGDSEEDEILEYEDKGQG